MISEGLVEEGLTMIKAIHDRYAPEKRNPYNEIEYGNHYIRAMSSYGAFIAASGFTIHEPKGQIGFSPKITPNNFKSAFITGNGWGTYSQKAGKGKQEASIELAYGAVKLQQVSIDDLSNAKVVLVKLNGKNINAKSTHKSGKIHIRFKTDTFKKGRYTYFGNKIVGPTTSAYHLSRSEHLYCPYGGQLHKRWKKYIYHC